MRFLTKENQGVIVIAQSILCIMTIYNDCKIIINLNQLVRDRPCGRDLDDEHVDQVSNDLRRRMTFDSLFEQVDCAIWDYCDEVGIDLKESQGSGFGFQITEEK